MNRIFTRDRDSLPGTAGCQLYQQLRGPGSHGQLWSVAARLAQPQQRTPGREVQLVDAPRLDDSDEDRQSRHQGSLARIAGGERDHVGDICPGYVSYLNRSISKQEQY